jgi:dTDP-4-dehydrorhamnose reductase
MHPSRILITGGSGLLALNWACCMRASHEVILAQHTRKIHLRGTRCVSLDLASAAALARDLESLRPDLVVHTAGLASVDLCEQHPDQAMNLNATLAANVASACRQLDIKLVHISTDHLFPGDKAFSTESDAPSPLNVYARTKLLAEQSVAREHPGAVIVRTNFFGWGHQYRQSLSDWILATLRSGQVISMYEDVYFSPLLADRLAQAVHLLVARGISGIYNVSGDDRLSKHDFALRLARLFGLPETLIRRTRIASAASRAVRPLDMSLDNGKAVGCLGAGLGKVDDSLRELKAQAREGRARELINAVTE